MTALEKGSFLFLNVRKSKWEKLMMGNKMFEQDFLPSEGVLTFFAPYEKEEIRLVSAALFSPH